MNRSWLKAAIAKVTSGLSLAVGIRLILGNRRYQTGLDLRRWAGSLPFKRIKDSVIGCDNSGLPFIIGELAPFCRGPTEALLNPRVLPGQLGQRKVST